MDNRTIGVAIPNYNRDEILFDSFAEIVESCLVSHIHISDDASTLDIFRSVDVKIHERGYSEKISLSRNLTNQDCFLNKRNAVLGTKAEWVLLGDSDNVFGIDYLSKLTEIGRWEEDTIYTPDFAFPNFDFRAYSGLTITKENVAKYIDLSMFETMLNAANYFVNKKQYLSLDIWDKGIDPVTSDSIYVCLKWLEKGNKIKVVEDLQYFHRVWENSHYRTNINRTPVGFHQSILNQLRQLK